MKSLQFLNSLAYLVEQGTVLAFWDVAAHYETSWDKQLRYVHADMATQPQTLKIIPPRDAIRAMFRQLN